MADLEDGKLPALQQVSSITLPAVHIPRSLQSKVSADDEGGGSDDATQDSFADADMHPAEDSESLAWLDTTADLVRLRSFTLHRSWLPPPVQEALLEPEKDESSSNTSSGIELQGGRRLRGLSFQPDALPAVVPEISMASAPVTAAASERRGGRGHAAPAEGAETDSGVLEAAVARLLRAVGAAEPLRAGQEETGAAATGAGVSLLAPPAGPDDPLLVHVRARPGRLSALSVP
jgi:hypothetical protein